MALALEKLIYTFSATQDSFSFNLMKLMLFLSGMENRNTRCFSNPSQHLKSNALHESE